MAKFSLKFDTPSMRRVCEIWNASENGSTAAHNFGYFTVVQYLHGTVMQVFVFLRTVIELEIPRMSVSSSCNYELMSAFCTLKSNNVAIHSGTCRSSKSTFKVFTSIFRVLCIYLQITVNDASIFFQFKQVGEIFKIIAFQI